MKCRSILFILFLIPILCKCQIAQFRQQHDINNPDIVLTCIYGNDCPNCLLAYMYINQFLDQHKTYKNIILLSGISKDDANYFLAKKLNIDTLATSIIVDPIAYTKINTGLVSSVLIVHDTTIIYRSILKLLTPESLSDIQPNTKNTYTSKAVKSDTSYNNKGNSSSLGKKIINVSGIVNANTYQFRILSDSVIILHNTARNRISMVNIYSKRTLNTFPYPHSDENSLYTKLLNASSITPVQKSFSLKRLYEADNPFKHGIAKYTIEESKFFIAGKYYYVWMSFCYSEMRLYQGDSIEAILKHFELIKLDNKFNITVIYDVPETLPNEKNCYVESLNDINFNTNVVYLNVRTDINKNGEFEMNHDSLLASFKMLDNKLIFDTHYPLSQPKYFPLTGPMGLPWLFEFKIFDLNNVSYYYYTREPIIYELANHKRQLLKDISYIPFDTTLVKIKNCLMDVYPLNSKVYTFSFQDDSLYINKYNTHFNLETRTSIGKSTFLSEQHYKNEIWIIQYMNTDKPILTKYTLPGT